LSRRRWRSPAVKTIYDHLDMSGAAEPHPNEEQFQREFAECRNQGAMKQVNDGWDALIVGNIIQNCMRSKGWVARQ
jgi:hypothetical protein